MAIFDWLKLGRQQEQEDGLVNVKAPVVLNARTRSGAQPLTDFVKGLERNSNVAIAAAEGERLMPYFNAMSGFITRTLDQITPVPETEAVKVASSAAGLRDMFNLIAEKTRNTLISDVAILPMTVTTTGPLSHFFMDKDQFLQPYDCGGFKFIFGFVQVFEGGKEKDAKSSTTFPVFLLDEKMTDIAGEHKAENVLRGLQSVMSFVNHDMLHHFTLPVINANVAQKFTFDGTGETAQGSNPLNEWLKQLPVSGNRALYEDWAQMSQEKTLLAPENAAQVEQVKNTVTQYFTDLKVMTDTIAKKSPEKAHQAADYYGMVMAHALTRVFPLDHPVMSHCLDKLHETDPSPSKPTDVVMDMMSLSAPRGEVSQSLMKQLRVNFSIGKEWGQIFDSYRKQGIDLLPAKDEDLTWKNMKLLQLLRMSFADIHPHMSAPVNDSMKQLRDTTDKEMLKMLSAAQRTFKPQTPV